MTIISLSHRLSLCVCVCVCFCVCVCVCACPSDPEFVSASFIQQDPTSEPLGDDDKLYFFFTEVAKEYEMYTKVKVPRVARVCKVPPGTEGVSECVCVSVTEGM